MEIPADLPSALMPVVWLLGRWEGAGVGGYPTIGEFRFGQEITFSHDGRDFLVYESRSWLLEDDGSIGAPMARESGFWRIQPDGVVEVTLAHWMGYAEIWLGEVSGAKVELRSDVVARTDTAKEYSAGHRLYGLVEGDLLWAFDMAAVGQQIQPHVSARLKRVG